MRSVARTLLVALALIAGIQHATAQLKSEPRQRSFAPTVDPGRSPVIESEFEISWIFSGQIFWLDRDRVLFSANPGGKRDHKSGSALYVWNIPSNRISKYADGGRLCFFQGFIRYIAPGRGGQAMVVEGRFGEEKTRPRWPEDENTYQSPIDCRVYPYKTIPRNEFNAPLVPLAFSHGLLDLGDRQVTPQFQSWPIAFLREPDATPIPLPIETREVSTLHLEYAEHLNSYVLVGRNPKGMVGPWPKGRGHPVYLLAEDGAVTVRTIPDGPWLHGPAPYTSPTPRGVFFTSHQVASRAQGGHAGGVYVVEGGRVRRLVSGIPEAARVSPDGCRAAWALGRYPSKERLMTMQAADLCD